MKLCPHCGAALPADAALCSACNTVLPPAQPQQVRTASSGSTQVGSEEQPAPPAAPADGSDDIPSQGNGQIRFEADPPDEPPLPQSRLLHWMLKHGAAEQIPADQLQFEFEPEFAPADPPRKPGPRYAPLPEQQPDGSLTTAQYFWTLVLFAVPLVGLGFMLYWSFGRTTSPARRKLARASLIKTGVFGVTGLLAAVILAISVLQFGRTMLNEFAAHYNPYSGYFEDDSGDWYEPFPFDWYEGSQNYSPMPEPHTRGTAKDF
ncbi:MAG: hypothetical protein IJ347_07945 [Faecalibacterium sp.]|nr:hypothetical protein [Faecalibacterium sp.]